MKTPLTDGDIDPELRGSTPRRVVFSASTLRRRRIAWNVLLAILCLICYLGTQEYASLKDLQAHGRTLTGCVVYQDGMAGDSNNHIVSYAFKHGATHADGMFVLRDDGDGIPAVGDKFQVTFMPDNPRLYVMGAIDASKLAACCSYWSGIAALVGVPYLIGLWGMYGYMAGRRDLLRNGFAVVATVSDRRGVKTGETYVYYLTYRFKHPRGRWFSREISVSKKLFDYYKQGSQFTVLINSTDAHYSEPYFSLRSVEIEGAPKRNFA